MKILFLSKADRKLLYAACNTIIERDIEAAIDEMDDNDRAEMYAEADTYRRLAKKLGGAIKNG